MKFLSNDKAPYFLVVLLAIIGWLALQLVEEVRSTQTAVSYSVDVDRNTGNVFLLIENRSKSTAVPNAEYSLVCRGPIECFAPDVNIRPIAPFSLVTSHILRERNIIALQTRLPPGARFMIEARLANSQAGVEFYFREEADRQQSVYVYDRNTFMGNMADNFTSILISLLVLCVAALAAYVIHLGRLEKGAGRQGKPKAPKTLE